MKSSSSLNFFPTQKTRTVVCKGLIYIGFIGIIACSRSTYPCPDIHGGTEVVKEGSSEGLKKVEPDRDANGRLVKKPYSHSKMKKKR